MSADRMKLPAILATVVGAGLALLSWSQTWYDLVLVSSAGGAASGDAIAVLGSIASPALAALGLAGLALVAALAIAGPGIRIILGVLEVLLGGSIVLAAVVAIGDPVTAVSPAVTDATGVAGSEPTAALVAGVTPTFWPAAAVIAGAVLILAGVLVLATGTRWPASSRRYRGARLEEHRPGEPALPASDRAIDDWDELSRGDDPTDNIESGHDTESGDGARPGDGAGPADGTGPTRPNR
ncbi:Trp biosynthesis-associated membrane protein [Agromyces sp. SYSU K20354]|uniref:Trp biosynthesis-associated membrane protein n=1 Tax=Agromyces cavernae TaxID=2898659 RepID=UPI001E3FBDAD|nr:Trp biosynthesis-associated membrane protein [Agromyces cavernae]MCD2442276.1 Trp biosynthesis-associated membrane protein [Agromyces cavernae]